MLVMSLTMLTLRDMMRMMMMVMMRMIVMIVVMIKGMMMMRDDDDYGDIDDEVPLLYPPFTINHANIHI